METRHQVEVMSQISREQVKQGKESGGFDQQEVVRGETYQENIISM